MPGLAIATASSAAWSEMGAQAERAWNTGWGFDQRADGAGGFISNASPTSSGFTFQSTGDATAFYLTGRAFKSVQVGGTTSYGTVGLSSFAGGITTVYVNQFSTAGSTVMSTGVISSVAVSPTLVGFGGNIGGLFMVIPSTGGDSSLAVGAKVATAGALRVPNGVPGSLKARNFANTGDLGLIYLDASNVVQVADGGMSANAAGQVTVVSVITIGSATGGNLVTAGTLTAGGLLGSAVQICSAGPLIYSGFGTPTISAAVKGSLYLRSDGTTTTNRLYVATDTVGGWTAVTTAA